MEVISNDVWGAFCRSENWNDNVASVICRELGFAGVVRIDKVKVGGFYKREAAINWLVNGTCKGDENELRKCKVASLKAVMKCSDLLVVKCLPGAVYIFILHFA